ncbi:ATP-binding protein [Microterricola viridarii]|uniref:Uncharacterized protein YPO0396 n=1 Tax=Microterricola viridarii TaxID=412690 RepID=A0A1H1Y512_9MICO|nr:SbcC/MukB-like Walker B domain-containing protein [Microterricola viridarii]SDT16475.1 Uncharacterized protein YPO0396 [Microterricola viridarii]
MSDSPLFYIDGATEGTTQWRAETFQMVNWGGFHGHHSVDLATTATLVSGASGTGKSTLLDAYLALMMPSDTPFNGASNDAGSGRARSAEQRNVLTYLRGKTDDNREAETGALHDQVLRGGSEPTWGAIAMTFVDDNQRRFTVLRSYYVPRATNSYSEVSMRMATFDGALHLGELEDVVPAKFEKRALKARFAGIEVFDTYAAFAQTLYTRLGIGANGEGGKALRLLARIQAGQQVKTVDGLYKSMVLERPATYAAADKAVNHFEDLERSYGAMVTEAQKAQVLERLPELQKQFVEASDRADLVDTFGVARSGDTPLRYWELGTEQRLLADAGDGNRSERKRVQAALSAATAAEKELKAGLAESQRRQRENGGDVLAELTAEQARLTEARDDRLGSRARFEARVAVLAAPTRTAAEFAAAQAAAAEALAAFPDAQASAEAHHETLRREQYPLEEQVRTLKKERDFLAGRHSLVPQHLHGARLAIAEAAGMAPDELPFLAELIDLAPGEERWRQAAEVTLGSVARILLVDETKLAALSRAIDPLQLPVRIHFEGVPLSASTSSTADDAGTRHPAAPDFEAAFVSGKLVHKESPFTAWVRQRLRQSTLDARCVETPAEFDGDGPFVALSGQTRSGSRGAHGMNRDQKPIIGFSSQARQDEIEQELGQITASVQQLAGQAHTLANELAALRARRDASQSVVDAVWELIDVDAAEAQLAAKEAELARVLANSDVLRALQEEEQRLEAELEAAQGARFEAERAARVLAEAQGEIVDREDAVNAQLERITDENQVSLTEEQGAHLDAEFAAVGDPDDLETFAAGLKRLRERLTAQSASERERAASAAGAMLSIFESYQRAWPDPTIGTGLDSYQGYRDILDSVLTLGLHERRQEWKRRLAAWSGQDLVPLAGAFDSAISQIEDRLDPINDILSTLPFGAGRDRLQITLRRLHRDDSVAFRRELKQLSSGATEQFTDEQTEERFLRLQAFMAGIRKPEDESKPSPTRDLLLDVRRHVEVTATRLGEGGEVLSTYSSLGGKSGGESQELVAFVVGAALRFQLGDESRTRPRFAPVFLDEGFVKSDAEFAGRAVAAWKGLGFQLIVGAPLDKVTALEPYMDLVLSITKNHAAGFSYITPIADAAVPAAAPALARGSEERATESNSAPALA